jgi:hypothetical protein
MPHRPVEAALAERVVGLLEQAGQVPQVPAAVLAQRGFQFGGMTPAGDQVRVGVRLAAAGPECCPALKMPTKEAFAMPMW